MLHSHSEPDAVRVSDAEIKEEGLVLNPYKDVSNTVENFLKLEVVHSLPHLRGAEMRAIIHRRRRAKTRSGVNMR